MGNIYKALVDKREGRRPLGLNRRIILRRTLKTGCGSVERWLKIRTSGEKCEHGNEPSGFIKGKEFIE
jgi:hypothetical protein